MESSIVVEQSTERDCSRTAVAENRRGGIIWHNDDVGEKITKRIETKEEMQKYKRKIYSTYPYKRRSPSPIYTKVV
jgi:hypothetical protein